jgi:protein-S-isoprenylcysteine O-methyltransferase Ste14
MFMSWDAARTGFTAVPPWLQAAGALCILLNGAGTWWTFRENTFAAPVVKIQEGQKVIDTGPYAFVRHPMYASTLFLFIGVPLLLGSWLGLAFAAMIVLGLAWRAVREENTLRAELPGYDAYAARVRYRLVPFVW